MGLSCLLDSTHPHQTLSHVNVVDHPPQAKRTAIIVIETARIPLIDVTIIIVAMRKIAIATMITVITRILR